MKHLTEVNFIFFGNMVVELLQHKFKMWKRFVKTVVLLTRFFISEFYNVIFYSLNRFLSAPHCSLSLMLAPEFRVFICRSRLWFNRNSSEIQSKWFSWSLLVSVEVIQINWAVNACRLDDLAVVIFIHWFCNSLSVYPKFVCLRFSLGILIRSALFVNCSFERRL